MNYCLWLLFLSDFMGRKITESDEADYFMGWVVCSIWCCHVSVATFTNTTIPIRCGLVHYSFPNWEWNVICIAVKINNCMFLTLNFFFFSFWKSHLKIDQQVSSLVIFHNKHNFVTVFHFKWRLFIRKQEWLSNPAINFLFHFTILPPKLNSILADQFFHHVHNRWQF
jgi:hypothetical protein